MQKKQLLHKKPGYFRGQLLLEDDFIAEQRYHASARYRHTLNLHGWGVVRGLEVTRIDETTLAVSPGFAIDQHGHEIELHHEERLSLASVAEQSQVAISLVYEEDAPSASGGEAGQHALNCYAVLSVAVGVPEAAIVLATVHIDEKGHVGHGGIRFDNRHYLKTPILPGSVTPAALDAQLRMGWLRMPFRPLPIAPETDDEPPPFRVGPTEARVYRDYDRKPNTRGALGSMTIALPPGVTRVLRLRLAGEENETLMRVSLVTGRWDPDKRKHLTHHLVKAELKAGAFDTTWEVEKGELHLETSTLSLELHCDGYARVSLVAVQVTYDALAVHASAPTA
ncbi:MAG TPA: hypothetical protein VEI25_12175 [Paraburkholderia sp.]|nr:hypothetical protein [Paraburkholderia sp.]